MHGAKQGILKRALRELRARNPAVPLVSRLDLETTMPQAALAKPRMSQFYSHATQTTKEPCICCPE